MQTMPKITLANEANATSYLAIQPTAVPYLAQICPNMALPSPKMDQTVPDRAVRPPTSAKALSVLPKRIRK